MIDFHSYLHPDRTDVLVFEIAGNLDSDSAAYFFSCVETAIQEGQTQFVIDCARLEYISSLGLGMLMRVHSRMKKVGGIVKLARLQSTVADVFATVGFDIILQIYSSVGDASASF